MSQINRNNYQKLAQRTNGTLEGDEHLRHMQYGIITETAELFDILKKKLAYQKDIDLVNFKEELGDLCWYLANGMTELEINFSEQFIPIELDRGVDFYLTLIVQQAVFLYPLEETFQPPLSGITYSYYRTAYSKIAQYVYKICDLMDFDFDKILETNILKLQARYPEKFTNEAALNRNLEEERKILEQ